MTKINTRKKLNLKNDVVFKTFFSRKGNEEYLIDFLTSLLKIEIRKIQIREEVNLEKLSQDEKGGRLDLQAELNGGIIINIEMQIENKYNIEKRSMIYGAKTISKETKRGRAYEEVKQVIQINILDYEFLGFDEYISETVIVLDKHREYEIMKDMKWYFIELPKFRKINPDMNEKVNQWIAFIDDYDRGLIKMAEKKNKTLEKARVEMNYLTGDEEVKRIVELREKWDMDYASGIYNAKKEGKEEGIKEGKKEGKKEDIKNMLKEKIDIKIISKVTGIPLEEIQKMKINNN